MNHVNTTSYANPEADSANDSKLLMMDEETELKNGLQTHNGSRD